MILNKAAHDAYHAGQVRYLRALLGALNDEMVTRLVKQRAIPAGPIEAAFRAVARDHFLPSVPLETIYSGEAVITRRASDGNPISSSSMPEIMASMLQQLDVQTGHRVLEVGAGTGYNAALLSALTGSDGEVTTIDIDEAIVREARERLDVAGHPAVRTVTGDGWLGAPEHAPYDRIEVTVGVSDLSPSWRAQLKDGGRLVVPLWLARSKQFAVGFQKDGDRLRSVAVTDCGFMRLRGPHAGPETYVTVHGRTIGLDEPTLPASPCSRRSLRVSRAPRQFLPLRGGGPPVCCWKSRSRSPCRYVGQRETVDGRHHSNYAYSMCVTWHRASKPLGFPGLAGGSRGEASTVRSPTRPAVPPLLPGCDRRVAA